MSVNVKRVLEWLDHPSLRSFVIQQNKNKLDKTKYYPGTSIYDSFSIRSIGPTDSVIIVF